MTPSDDRDRARFVSEMFGRISHRYDLLNTIMTIGRHRTWRKQAVETISVDTKGVALDIASGTGDFAFDLLQNPLITQVVGLDFSLDMLRVGILKAHKRNLSAEFLPVIGDSHSLPYGNNSFACATVGFGIRNFANIGRAMAEMLRVVRPGGTVVVLEIVKPQGFLMARIFPMYFRTFTPVLGGIFAGEREAYDYLPQSVQGFKTASELAVTMENGGLRDVNVDLKALGTVAIVSGRKPG